MFAQACAVYLASTRVLLSPEIGLGKHSDYEHSIFGLSEATDTRTLISMPGKALAKLAELFNVLSFRPSITLPFGSNGPDIYELVEAKRGVLSLLEEPVLFYREGIRKLEVEIDNPHLLTIRIYQGDPGEEWYYTMSYCGEFTIEWEGSHTAAKEGDDPLVTPVGRH